ncbi:MAG: hypothetical protein Q8P59_09835 [Dehalococcoidia bacterium]|nr:hypothetical protein [Dehalococcoidia bacterium]
MGFKRLEVWKEGFRWGTLTGVLAMVVAAYAFKYLEFMKHQEAASSLSLVVIFMGFGGMFGYDAGLAHGHREMKDLSEKKDG